MAVNDSELNDFIQKMALMNAAKHNGKASAEAVVGKILGQRAEFRSKIREITRLVNTVISEINSLEPNEQLRILNARWPGSLVKEKPEEKRLPSLPNASITQVVTRFSPNPDCVLHLGSARAIVLDYEYARMYRGKFILRFEDTDPKIKRPVMEFYDSIREDLAWLHCEPDEEYIQSDRVPIYYEYSEMLLKDGNAYICLCSPEEFRRLVTVGKQCECRNCSVEEHLERWRRMIKGEYGEAEAVLRIKTDLSHPNPAVRDWPAMRVIDNEKYPHPRVGGKYHAWPLYNLASGIDDHLMGVTHIIRGKEHLTNKVRQEYMYHYLGWDYPDSIHYGRLKITGASLSKSKIVKGVREGTYNGWDDPRLATFAALRRRGITPDAIKKMIVEVGPKTSDVILSWENLYAYNRKILDAATDRYFFTADPVELTVRNVPKALKVRLDLHPDHPERGFREYLIKPDDDQSVKFWVSRKDVNSSKVGIIFRLIELFNIKIEKANMYSSTSTFLSEAYEDARDRKVQLIQWVPQGQDVACQVIMPDATVVDGAAEGLCRRLSPDTEIQFERFGFVRIDKVADKLTVYYSHK